MGGQPVTEAALQITDGVLNDRRVTVIGARAGFPALAES